MFESLDEQIRRTELETTRGQRLLRAALALVVTALVLGGLYAAVRLIEY